MTIITNLHLRSPSLPLVSIAESTRAGEIECIHGLSLQPGLQLFIVGIDADEDVSEARLSAFDEVVEATALGRSSGKTIFKLTVELDEAVSDAFDGSTDAALMDSILVTPAGWYEEKLFKDYAALSEFQTACQGGDIDVEIISLNHDRTSFEDDSPYGLTKRQHEALTLALSRGYYERPRRVTAAELAEELDISQPSMSDLLRRGERQLLTATLDSRGYINTLSK
ncbi:helix-turn-helix domain-containing protein [Haloferax marisrubri]|uniref:helix-turn-helix domain-containing protein n=1 Tax=Haloferax marisrubri TaxID=1544719 RepID=UPI000A5F2987|nr:helix-turn-helix domain-containing protein [Haloferax marisrubri]